MYARVIFRKNGHSILYECQQVTFNKLLKSDDDNILFVDIKGDKNCETIELNKAQGDELYIMNNEGKTIETHRWDTERTRISKARAKEIYDNA